MRFAMSRAMLVLGAVNSAQAATTRAVRLAPVKPAATQFRLPTATGVHTGVLTDYAEKRLLTREEEVGLALSVQRLRALEDYRAALAEGTGRDENHIPLHEWALVAGVSEDQLSAERQRGAAARATLTSSNLRLVASIANRFRYCGLDHEDLLQEGAFGLSRAVERFDPERGFRFSTYATFWIRQAALRALAEQSRVIRLPTHVHDQLASLRRATADLARELGRDATADELAERLDLKCSTKVDFLRRCDGQNPRSLEEARDARTGKGTAAAGGGGATACLSESLASEEPHPDEVVEEQTKHQLVKQIIESALSDRERAVLSHRFGLDGRAPVSKTKIAELLAVSRERVRQIEVRALTKLRRHARLSS